MRMVLPLLVSFSLVASAPVLAAERTSRCPTSPRSTHLPTRRCPRAPPEFPPEEPEDPAPPPDERSPPPPTERPGPFPQGKVRLGLGGGLFSSSNSVDFGLSAGFGYFIFDNIEIGFDGAFQFGDSAFAAFLGPTARVLFPLNEAVALYVGGFYRHWFLTEGLEDFDTLGARGGIVVRTGGAYFSIGMVYEAIVSACDGECSDLYPELGISVLF